MIGGTLSPRCGQDRYHIPAPVVSGVEITDAASGERHPGTWDALVDTGAGRSVIPEDACSSLGMTPFAYVRASGYDRSSSPTRRPVYHVSIHVPGLGDFRLNVTSASRSNVLLGRDFLQGLIFLMDGGTFRWAAGSSPP